MISAPFKLNISNLTNGRPLLRYIFLVVFAVIGLICASSANADPHPKGFTNHKFNGPSKPVTESGITTFKIFDEQCSNKDYGDGRGESDCVNGNIRSTLVRHPEDKLSESVEYQFDIWVDPTFQYRGYYNNHATGFLTDSLDSRLRIASWEGPFLHNFLYMLKLDAINGITFLGHQCQPKVRFGQWVKFSMKVRWAADKRGWIKVQCDDKIIYLKEDVATNQAPHCYITNQCEPGLAKKPKRFLFILGPIMAGFGHEWKKWGMASPFTKIQPEGITIKMRNVSVKKGAKL
jgi:hypothetical protein